MGAVYLSNSRWRTAAEKGAGPGWLISANQVSFLALGAPRICI
jgi:hypothetical protein